MDTKKLKLSIVIPAYNEERYLRACLESVVAQLDPADEVIVVDNGSTDATASIAEDFAEVRLINEKRRGALFARSRGFDAARGDIIARIDADSRLPAGWAKTVRKLFDDQSVAAVTGPAFGYDLPLASLNWLPHHLLCLMLISLPPRLPFLFGFNMALRRSAWLKIRQAKCRAKDLHEDLDLAIHLHQAGYRLLYSRRMLIAASGRRYNDPLPKFHAYMRTYGRTFKRHGLGGWTLYLAIGAYYLGYLLYRPWTWHLPARPSPIST